jgi:hypothetical protein
VDAAIEAWDLLGAGRFFQARERTSLEFWRQIQNGIPIESFDLVVKRVPTPARAVAQLGHATT